MATFDVHDAKLDRLFKVLNNKARGTENFEFFEEAIPSVVDVHATDIYFDIIPTGVNIPTTTTTTIRVYTPAGDGRLILTKDGKYNNNRVWVAKGTHSTSFSSGSDPLEDILQNWVSPKYDTGYIIKVYDGSDVVVPELADTSWMYDYKAGVLTFEQTRGEDGSNTTTEAIKIDAYQYIGKFVRDLAISGHTHVLDDLTDVSVAGDDAPEDQEILRWFSASGAWLPDADATGSGGGGASSLVDLSDTIIGVPASGELLVYNGTEWINASGKLIELSDTQVAEFPANNNILAWDTAANAWIDQTATQAALAADGHDHFSTDITNFSDAVGSGVTFENLNANSDVGTGATQVSQGDHLHAISDLSDTTITAPASGELLRYDGTTWENASGILRELDDTAVAEFPTDNNVLAFDTASNKWIDQTAAEAALAAAGHAHALDDLTDVSVLGDDAPANEEVLTWFSASGAWLPAPASGSGGGAVATLGDLTDVSVPIPESGHLLRYTGTIWSHGSGILRELDDTKVAEFPTDNNVLAFDTTSNKWTDQTASEAGLAVASHAHVAADVTDFYPEASGTVTYEALSDNGDIGTGATQVSQGDHNHDATYAQLGHDHFSTDITNFDDAVGSGVTFENLNANSDVGTGATQVAQGDHLHDATYSPVAHSHTLTELNDVDASGDEQPADNEVLTWIDASGRWYPRQTDHANLANLSADDHTQYSLADGSRAFSGTVGGVNPASAPDLTTKAYVDSTIGASGVNYAEAAHTHALTDLSDATITAPASGELVRYDGSEWQNASGILRELDDTAVAEFPTDNNVLAFDTAANKWTDQTPSEAGLAADGHDHFSTDITNFDDAVGSGVTFENLNANSDVGTGATQVAQGDHDHDGTYSPVAHSHTLTELNDVDATGNEQPADNEVLTWISSSGQWYPRAAQGGASAIGDLTDVTITSADAGDLIRYNGADWVDYPESNYSFADHTHPASGITNFYPEASGTVTYEALSDNGDIGTGATQVAQGDHDHDATYSPIDHSHTLTELNDVNASGNELPADNEVLTWIQSSGAWYPRQTIHANLADLSADDHAQYTLADGTRAFSGAVSGINPTIAPHLTTKAYVDSTIGASGSNRILDDLADVTIAAAASGELLRHNGTEWQNASGILRELDDTAVAEFPTDNNLLAFDTTQNKWIDQTAAQAGLAVAGHTHELNDLSDVEVAGDDAPDNQDVLTWFSASGAWLPAPASGSGGGGLDNIVEDLSPELGAALDAQGFDLTNLGNLQFIDSNKFIGTATTPASGLFAGVFSVGTGVGLTTPSIFNPSIINHKIDSSTQVLDGLRIIVENENTGASSGFRGLFIRVTPRATFGTASYGVEVELDDSSILSSSIIGPMYRFSHQFNNVDPATISGLDISMTSTGAARPDNLISASFKAEGADTTNIALRTLTGDTLLNEEGGSYILRVEGAGGNGSENLLYVDGATNRVGILKVPTTNVAELEVSGHVFVSASLVAASGVDIPTNELYKIDGSQHTHLQTDITDFGSFSPDDHSHTLTELNDVDATGDRAPADGELLTWISASGKWLPQVVPGGGDLNSLSDVTITSPASGAVLAYDGTEWIDLDAVTMGVTASGAPLNININATDPASTERGDIWILDSTPRLLNTVFHQYGPGGTGTIEYDHDHSIYSLTDGTRPFTGTVGGVTPAASTDVAIKSYVDDSIAASGGGSGATELDELTDVTITTPIHTGQSLMYDGSLWINTSGILRNLGDVSINGALQDNDLLAFDSASDKWIDQTATQAGVLSDIVFDTSPSLGGPLDAESNNISNLGNLTFNATDFYDIGVALGRLSRIWTNRLAVDVTVPNEAYVIHASGTIYSDTNMDLHATGLYKIGGVQHTHDTDDITTGELDVAQGGTNLASGTDGGILGFTGTTTIASSALLTQFLLVVGGGTGATPSTPVAIGTAGQFLRSGGAAANPAFAGINLDSDTLSGTLAVAQGGTNLSSGTSGGVLAYTAAGTLASSALLTANQLVIGGGAGVAPGPLAAGTDNFIVRMGTSIPAYEEEVLSKSVSIETPTAADDITMFFTPVAITITQMRIAILGSATPGWIADLRHHTDRSNAGNAVITTPVSSTAAEHSAETTGHDITTFNDATVPANSFVWVETVDVSGTLDQGHLTLRYTID